MNKLFLIVFLFFTGKIASQSFSITHGSLSKTDSVGSEIIFEFTVTNNTNGNLTLDLIRTQNDLPWGWSSSLCFSSCFAPFIDSVSTTSDFGSSPLNSNETRNFSLHVFPMESEGTARISIQIKNHAVPSESKSFEITASANLSKVNIEKRPTDFFLSQNYPNPFGSKFSQQTVIKFSVPEEHNPTKKMMLGIYNILGEKIVTLINGVVSAGEHSIVLNSTDLPSGIYFIRLSYGKHIQIKKMIVEK